MVAATLTPWRRWFPVVRWLIAVMLLSALSACEEPLPPLKIRIGESVPPLSVQDLRQQPAILKPSPDRLLMINVWATWCGPCRHEMPSLQRLAQRLGEDRLELVGLSVDGDEHVVREYLIENGITFPSLLDSDLSEVFGVLGVRVYPSTFFVRPDGTLVKVVEGWREWDAPALVESIEALLPPLLSAPAVVKNAGQD